MHANHEHPSIGDNVDMVLPVLVILLLGGIGVLLGQRPAASAHPAFASQPPALSAAQLLDGP